MAKKREDIISQLKKEQELSQPPGPPVEPKYLTESCLYLKTDSPEKLKSTVPPTSPKQLIYDYSFTSLPDLFPKLANLDLPYIREVGIKASIQQLAEYFQCVDYKFNLIQFWFLDIITDCLWRAQDEFQFPDEHQKIILEWILYIFNLIRAPHLNLTRNKLFKLFKEAMVIAEDYIESGCSAIPLPEELFALNLEQGENKGESYTTLNSSGSSISTDSTISLDSSSVASSYVAVKFEENTQLFKLPTKPCTWGSDDECLSSSVETMSEEEKPQEEEVESLDKQNEAEEATLSATEDIAEFFKKPDLKKIPPRFLPSHESVVDSISISVETETSEEIKEDIKGSMWVDVAFRPPKPDCPSEIIHRNDIDEQSNVTDETLSKDKEEEVIRAWFDYYVWQQRLEDMDNPRRGWIPMIDNNGSVIGAESDEVIRNDVEKWEWLNYIRGKQEETKRIETNIFINTCVLLAIKQFTFDYFYESFPFSLLRMAFRCPHHLITQEVNDKWYVPKLIKSDLKKPKPKKPKKEKVKKPKKDKKAKPKKKDKKGGKKKDKGGKSSKGSKKKEKAKKLTKEEKAELARLKKEQEAIEAAIRKAEENRRFMFPLGEAATDDFFKDIFPGWVKIEKKEKGKKDKKGKKK